MPKPRDRARWLLRKPPAHASSLLYCFPYAGVGASSYRGWPDEVEVGAVCPLQPPGRENRYSEPPHTSHRDYAEDLGQFIAGYADRPYSFFAHCGGVPFALETMLWLEENDIPLPQRLFVSAWGAPHKRLYGPLNAIDLETHDLVGEIRRLFERLGTPAVPELAEIGARVLHQELVVHRPWLYDPARQVPSPVTAIAWAADDVVPVPEVHDGWTDCSTVDYVTLAGDHLAFLDCPANLRELMSRTLAGQ